MTERPNPRRITWALDAAGLFGPDADAQLGVAEPALDLWESGALVPTGEQLAELARRAGVDVEFFYTDEPPPWSGWVCFRTKKAAGGGSRCQPLHSPAAESGPVQGALF